MRQSLRAAIATLSALIACMTLLGVPSGASAADDSNIPGVPLPGPVVIGTLGGDVYDRVYSIDVHTQSVILLSLTGDPGTDFDLYLFDGTATTVYESQGLIASSTGPASTESISFATSVSGRYYINLNGASEIQGNFRLVVTMSTDTAPPTASVELDGGGARTRSDTVMARVTASDALSGIDQISTSVDGDQWSPWFPFAPTVLWPLGTGDGTKHLWVRVRDKAGNVSVPAHDDIILDTRGPEVAERDPGPEGIGRGVRPVLEVTFSEPIVAASWAAQGIVLRDAAGTTIPGEYRYVPARRTGTFRPSVSLVPGDRYTASVGAVVDEAGNPIVPTDPWTFTAVSVPGLTLLAAPRAVTPNTRVNLQGAVEGGIEGAVSVERSVGGGPWLLIGSASPDASGRFILNTVVAANSAYRAHVAASATIGETFSSPTTVTVRRQVSLAGSSATATRSARAGQLLALRVTLTPAAPNTVVSLTIYRLNTATRAYAPVSTLKRTSSGGVATFSWRPTAGSYYLRITTPDTALFKGAVSSAYKWIVR